MNKKTELLIIDNPYSPIWYEGKEINCIHFFDKNGIVAITSTFTTSHIIPYAKIVFDFDLERMKTPNFDTYTPHYVKTSNKFSDTYDLYIPTSVLPIELVAKKQLSPNITRKYFSVNIKAVKKNENGTPCLQQTTFDSVF
jgi:hypothetical protein